VIHSPDPHLFVCLYLPVDSVVGRVAAAAGRDRGLRTCSRAVVLPLLSLTDFSLDLGARGR
jgi:hypothetical protein